MNLGCRPLAFTSYKAFLKKKRGLQLVSLPHVLHAFEEKYLLMFYELTKFHCLVAFVV